MPSGATIHPGKAEGRLGLFQNQAGKAEIGLATGRAQCDFRFRAFAVGRSGRSRENCSL